MIVLYCTIPKYLDGVCILDDILNANHKDSMNQKNVHTKHHRLGRKELVALKKLQNLTIPPIANTHKKCNLYVLS